MFNGGRFYLRREFVDSGDVEGAKAAFRNYYISKGKERFAERVGYFAPKVGVQPTGLTVNELGNRWAACSAAGKLAFHWKCMMAPLTIIDYIVVHELCHLIVRDHSDTFWNELDKVMPEYLERKAWLQKNGAGLD